MPAITPEDWGRIYAFIWKDARTGTGEYKKLFEKDPNRAVKEITEKLGIIAGPTIDYYDRLFDVDDATDFTVGQLEAIMNGTDTTSFRFFLRLSC
jgi:hypothetical protein